MTEPADMSVLAAVDAISNGEMTALELTESCLKRIESEEGRRLNAFIHVDAEGARAAALESDERAKASIRLSPIDGVPIAVKDNIDIFNMPTSNGLGTSWMPDDDAEVIAELREAGVVFLGKLNMHEGALGATTDNPHHGRCEHPTHAGMTPGGSSGGSATAVAAKLCPASLGSDTMGSVRLPAAYCGIVGFKPSRGYWSTVGVEPLSYRLDMVGPLARSVADIATLLREPLQPQPVSGVRFATLANFDQVDIDDEVRAVFEAGLSLLQQAGGQLDRFRIAGYKPSPARRAGFIASEVDAAVAHADRRAAYPDAYSPAFQKMLDYGASLNPGRYVTEMRHVEQVGRSLVHSLSRADVVVSPTAPQTAFAFDAPIPANQADLTALANFGGCPAISIPLPVPPGALPVGLQLLSQRGTDRTLLNIAAGVEELFRARLT